MFLLSLLCFFSFISTLSGSWTILFFFVVHTAKTFVFLKNCHVHKKAVSGLFSLQKTNLFEKKQVQSNSKQFSYVLSCYLIHFFTHNLIINIKHYLELNYIYFYAHICPLKVFLCKMHCIKLRTFHYLSQISFNILELNMKSKWWHN